MLRKGDSFTRTRPLGSKNALGFSAYTRAVPDNKSLSLSLKFSLSLSLRRRGRGGGCLLASNE